MHENKSHVNRSRPGSGDRGIMKFFITTLVISISVTASICPAEEQNATAAEPAAKPSRASGCAQVSDHDKQMDRAVENAQRNLAFFIAALRAKKSGDTVFEIKKGFIDGNTVEHLWVREVTYDGRHFHGKIDNQPRQIKNAHAGGRVTVSPEEVDDWMFLKDGKLIGGYTTRVLYARLSPEEKAEFDKRAEFKIE
jgi:uncharacterized protein YegJ (DUF2314 family)